MFFLGRVESGLPWVRKMGPETAVPSAAAIAIRVKRAGGPLQAWQFLAWKVK